jgi:hypothetical protein
MSFGPGAGRALLRIRIKKVECTSTLVREGRYAGVNQDSNPYIGHSRTMWY